MLACGSEVFAPVCREMFRRDADAMQHYPFYKDEWNKISYSDYRGIFPDQPSNTWFVVFRSVPPVVDRLSCVCVRHCVRLALHLHFIWCYTVWVCVRVCMHVRVLACACVCVRVQTDKNLSCSSKNK